MSALSGRMRCHLGHALSYALSTLVIWTFLAAALVVSWQDVARSGWTVLSTAYALLP